MCWIDNTWLIYGKKILVLIAIFYYSGDSQVREYLALSRDIFHCQNWRVGVQMASGMLMSFLEEADSPHNKELSSEDVISAEVEKLCYRRT